MFRVADHRGKRHAIRPARDHVDPQELTRARWWERRVFPERYDWILDSLFIAGTGFGVFIISAVVISFLPIDQSLSSYIALALGILALIPATTQHRKELQKKATSWIAIGRCGACKYTLGSETDDGGCTVCPECGAAWRLPQEHTNNAEESPKGQP